MEILLYSGHRVEVARRRYQKNLNLSVYPNGRIRVSGNKSLSQRQILRFLEQRSVWLEAAVAETQKLRKKYPPKKFVEGEVFPYLGCDYQLRIEFGSKQALFIDNDQLIFCVPLEKEQWSQSEQEKSLKLFKNAYRQVAEKIMARRFQELSQKMQLKPKGLQLRNQKSIWGSCSPDNSISLNFKLIVAPIEVIDYVIIHELAHIVHKNHSKNFWHLVEQYTPHRQNAKIWLKQNQYKTDFLSKKSDLCL